jgi:hypothetical protein
MKTVIKENEEFRLVLEKNSCLLPVGLNNIEMTREQLKDGEVIQKSTYQFFMTQEEIEKLTKVLVK